MTLETSIQIGRAERWLPRWRSLSVVLFVVAASWGVGHPTDARADEPEPPPWSAEREHSRPSDLRIRFVTFSPGESIPSWFGHSAIVVEDRRFGVSRLYNYGMFHFNGMLLVKFGMGRLWLWVGQQPERPTYRFYESLGRDVRIHHLDLPPEKRAQIARFLDWNVQPEHRQYLYHHYNDNCATRPRDIFDEAVGGALRRATSEPSALTLREHTRRFTHHNFFMDLLLMFMMNDNIDQPIQKWDAMFLPSELEKHVTELEYEKPSGERVPLVAKSEVYYEGDHRPIPDRAPAHWQWALLLGLLIGASGIAAARWWGERDEETAPRVSLGIHQMIVGFFIGGPGLGLYVMALGTNHSVTYWNENLFFANPLTFAALPIGALLAWGRRWTLEWLRWIWAALVATSALGLALKVLPGFDQQNHLPIAFLLPITVGCAAAFWYLEREQTAPETDAESA